MVGIGAFLIYEAVRSPAPTPVKRAKAALGATTKGG